MLTLKKSTLPATEIELRAALADYRSALDAHRLTEGVPAPWPDYDVLRDIVAAGGDFEVLDDLPPPLTVRERALLALAEEEASKRAAEQWALEEAMLQEAALRADAPVEVKEYIAEKSLLEAAPLSAVDGAAQ